MNKSTNTTDNDRFHGTIACPPWCVLNEAEHLAELNDPISQYSSHQYGVFLLERDGKQAPALATAAKSIPVEAGDDDSLRILIDGLPTDLTIDQARAVARGLEELADLVGGRRETARFTWRHLLAQIPHYRDTLVAEELDRDDVWFDRDPELADDVRTSQDAIGALLCWNQTKNVSTGHLIMLTGQTAEQESIVLDNAYGLVSQGVVYAVREGDAGLSLSQHKEKTHDHRVEVEGETFMVWLIGNDARWWK